MHLRWLDYFIRFHLYRLLAQSIIYGGVLQTIAIYGGYSLRTMVRFAHHTLSVIIISSVALLVSRFNWPS